jgi:hypothetical protein
MAALSESATSGNVSTHDSGVESNRSPSRLRTWDVAFEPKGDTQVGVVVGRGWGGDREAEERDDEDGGRRSAGGRVRRRLSLRSARGMPIGVAWLSGLASVTVA